MQNKINLVNFVKFSVFYFIFIKKEYTYTEFSIIANDSYIN